MSVIVPALSAKQQRLAIAGVKPSPGVTTAPAAGNSPGAVEITGSRWPNAYMTALVIGAAINEGVAFFAVIAYLIEKNPIALVLALVLIAGLVARFPTVNRVERWIEQQQEKLREEQLQASSMP
jgi:hypothetical protein